MFVTKVRKLETIEQIEQVAPQFGRTAAYRVYRTPGEFRLSHMKGRPRFFVRTDEEGKIPERYNALYLPRIDHVYVNTGKRETKTQTVRRLQGWLEQTARLMRNRQREQKRKQQRIEPFPEGFLYVLHPTFEPSSLRAVGSVSFASTAKGLQIEVNIEKRQIRKGLRYQPAISEGSLGTSALDAPHQVDAEGFSVPRPTLKFLVKNGRLVHHSGQISDVQLRKIATNAVRFIHAGLKANIVSPNRPGKVFRFTVWKQNPKTPEFYG